MKIKIRPGKFSDCKAMYNILNKTPQLLGIKGQENYSLGWVKRAVRKNKETVVLVADHGEKVVGFIIMSVSANLATAYLEDLFVIKEYRRKGIGAKLIKSCEKVAGNGLHICMGYSKCHKQKKSGPSC